MGVATLERTKTYANGVTHRLCDGTSKRTGKPCQALAISGMAKCKTHSGMKLELAKELGQASLEIARLEAAFGNVRDHVDPGEALLDVVTITRARVGLLATRLGRAWNAYEQDAQGMAMADGPDMAAVMAGGEKALVGHTMSANSRTGELYAAAEAVRGLAVLEGQERDRLARYAKAAIDANIAERQVRLAERMGEMVAGVLVTVVSSLGHDPEDDKVIEVMRLALESVTT